MTSRAEMVLAQYKRDLNTPEWRGELLATAAEMDLDGHLDKWPRGWLKQRLSRRIFSLVAQGRTGEAHALLVNAGFNVNSPRIYDPARRGATMTSDRLPCRYCEDGYIEDVNDMTAPWIECEFCEGTDDRYGRGPTLPNPSDPPARTRSKRMEPMPEQVMDHECHDCGHEWRGPVRWEDSSRLPPCPHCGGVYYTSRAIPGTTKAAVDAARLDRIGALERERDEARQVLADLRAWIDARVPGATRYGEFSDTANVLRNLTEFLDSYPEAVTGRAARERGNDA